MVQEKIVKDKSYFQCEKCGMTYKDEEWAERCEAWCSEHGGSCNLDIIKHAVTAGDEACC